MFKCNFPIKSNNAVDDQKQLTLEYWTILNKLVGRTFLDAYLIDGVPDASLGENGDFALDITGLKFYLKDATGWDAGTVLGNTPDTAFKLIKSRD